MKKTILILMALASLTIANAHADLGWTTKQARSAYGKPTQGPVSAPGGRSYYSYVSHGYNIILWYTNGIASRAAYSHVDGTSFNVNEVRALMQGNVPAGTTWGEVEDHDDGTSVTAGTYLGNVIYYTGINKEATVVAIFTAADDELNQSGS